MVYPPPRTFSVGFEENIVVEFIFIFYVFRPQNCVRIVISDFVLPSGRGGVKIWGLLFFWIFSKYNFSRNQTCHSKVFWV